MTTRAAAVEPCWSEDRPLRVHGSVVSYYTGKLEAYLRYKGIPYERVPPTPVTWNVTLRRKAGAMQMPAVELPDGRWLTDTTPIIEWMEAVRPEPAVLPTDEATAWTSRLVEDYADEWFWRPAMHYRWSHRGDALLLSRTLAEEMLGPLPLPGLVKRAIVRRRQHGGYVRRDGVTAETRAHVEATYLDALDQLEAVFARRPFLLGERPTLGDFGFFASMFRHFGSDPTPAAVMRDRAPGVYAWVARVWNATPALGDRPLETGVPDDWQPILEAIGRIYLPFLNENALAFEQGRSRFDFEADGVPYRRLPTSRYRVWCLERLRARFHELSPKASGEARTLLETVGAWEPLWRLENVDSGHDPEGRTPFGVGLRVFP